MLAYAVEAGRELAEAKKSLPHPNSLTEAVKTAMRLRGEPVGFQEWVAANLILSDRQAQKYMQVAKTAPQGAFVGDTGINAFLEAAATPREPSPLPQFTHDDAERILKLAAMANGGNVNEEIVACEMLDKMASRFGMTGEGETMRKPIPVPVPPGSKYCYTCATVKPVQSFYLDRSTLDGRCYLCRHCHRRALADRAHRLRIMSESWVNLRGR